MKNESNMKTNIQPNLNIVHARFRRFTFGRLWRAVVNWNARRIAIRELHAMPDNLLRDIGIERHQINYAVQQSGFNHMPHGANASSDVIPLRERKSALAPDNNSGDRAAGHAEQKAA